MKAGGSGSGSGSDDIKVKARGKSEGERRVRVKARGSGVLFHFHFGIFNFTRFHFHLSLRSRNPWRYPRDAGGYFGKMYVPTEPEWDLITQLAGVLKVFLPCSTTVKVTNIQIT